MADYRVLPFLFAAGLFVAFAGLFVSTMSGAIGDWENASARLIAISKYGALAGSATIGSSVVVPINYVQGYENVYGPTQPWAYYQATSFIWDKTNTYFAIEIIHDDNTMDNDGVGITLGTYGLDNNWYDASWFPQPLNWPHPSGFFNNTVNYVSPVPPTDIFVGQGWYNKFGIGLGVLTVPASFSPFLIPATVTYWIIIEEKGTVLSYTSNFSQNWPYNVQIHLDSIVRSYGTDNLTWGTVTLSFSTYETGISGALSKGISDLVGTVKGFFVGVFGAAFGDYGKTFVNSITAVLTMDFPGMPMSLRALIAVPMNLCIVYVLAMFIMSFVPFLGG